MRTSEQPSPHEGVVAPSQGYLRFAPLLQYSMHDNIDISMSLAYGHLHRAAGSAGSAAVNGHSASALELARRKTQEFSSLEVRGHRRGRVARPMARFSLIGGDCARLIESCQDLRSSATAGRVRMLPYASDTVQFHIGTGMRTGGRH